MAIDKAIHKTILVSILKDLYTDKTVGPFLGFKGGTAALLFYNLPRFSVDLDFDLLDVNREDAIFQTVNTILERYGTVKSRKKRYSLFFLLSYKNKVAGAQNVKVEINKRTFGSRFEIKNYLGIPMQVMLLQDIVANKLVALYERSGTASRDIFDVWFFLSNNLPANKEIVEKRVDLSYKNFLQKLIDLLENVSSRTILSGVGELIDNKQKNWVKEKLLSEVLFLIKVALENEST